MNLLIKILAGMGLLGFLVVAGWVAGRLTKTFEYYVVPTPANLPTMPMGSHFLASRHIRPQRLDFIVYNAVWPGAENSIWVHRLCGLPGDTVELRQGRLWVNGHDLDAQLNVAQHYRMSAPTYRRLLSQGRLADTATAYVMSDSAHHVALSIWEAQQHPQEVKRMLLPPSWPDSLMARHYPATWNQDHFGPYRVPAGQYFVLGDNRLNALDSRYAGPIPVGNFMGTVFTK